jgi:HK97 family phage portal protein
MTHDTGAGSYMSSWLFAGNSLLPVTKFDYENELGTNWTTSSVIAAPVNWIMRAFPEAPPTVEQLDGAEWKAVPGHDLTQLLKRPNKFYGGRVLWMATILDFLFGNAYWLKIRNVQGAVVQLWWVPRQFMTPKWPDDGQTYISHYEYKPASTIIPIDPKDVVHFRFGLDPVNTRLGLSQLGSMAREVYTDDQAANFAAAILKNLGIIGVVLSPKEKTGSAKPDDVKAVKEYIQKNFTGDSRGTVMALGAPTDVNVMQYHMQGFDVSPIRDVSEERVCAALGLPAAVVGFGTGLQQTKVGATMKELRQLAWTGCLIPMQEIMADEIDRALLPEFESDPASVRMRFDTAMVRALWEDKNEKHARVRADMLSGMITRGEARNETGRTALKDEADDVFLQPSNVVQLGPGNQVPQGTGASE